MPHLGLLLLSYLLLCHISISGRSLEQSAGFRPLLLVMFKRLQNTTTRFRSDTLASFVL